MNTENINSKDNDELQETPKSPKSDKPTLMTRLVDLAKNFMELWQSPDRQPFASLKFKDTGIHHLPLLGTEFKYVLNLTGTVLTGSGLSPFPPNPGQTTMVLWTAAEMNTQGGGKGKKGKNKGSACVGSVSVTGFVVIEGKS